MRRHVLTVCSGLSLLLCLAVCGVWVSRRLEVFPNEVLVTPRHLLEFARQGLTFQVASPGGMDGSNYHWEGWTWRGFGSFTRRYRQGSYHFYQVPYWPVVLALLVPPLLRAESWHRRLLEGRTSSNTCRACGYDLRATPDRCPECGRGAA